MDWEALYNELGTLSKTVPDLAAPNYSEETMVWTGRLRAAVRAINDISLSARLDALLLSTDVHQRDTNAEQIMMVLYQALAVAERNAPAAARGAFIPVHKPYDVLLAVTGVLKCDNRDVLIVDPFMDETTPNTFAKAAPENIQIRLLADANSLRPTLKPAVEAWVQQFGNSRPIEARVAASKSLHDRLLLIDGTQAYMVTQSFKDLAARSPAAIQRADADYAAMKIGAYEQIWAASTPLCRSDRRRQGQARSPLDPIR